MFHLKRQHVPHAALEDDGHDAIEISCLGCERSAAHGGCAGDNGDLFTPASVLRGATLLAQRDIGGRLSCPRSSARSKLVAAGSRVG